MTSADVSADHRPIAKTQQLSADDKKKYYRVVIFLSAVKKELKSDTLSAVTSADYRPLRRPIVGGVNVIAVLLGNTTACVGGVMSAMSLHTESPSYTICMYIRYSRQF